MADKLPTSKDFAAAALDAYNKFAAGRTNDTLRKLYDTLYNMDQALREEMQKNTLEAMKIIIAKLEKGTAPSPEEMQYVRLWLVGDAEAYARKEGDFNAWASELTRLMTEVTRTSAQAPNAKSMVDMQGTITDALGLIPNMQRYLESLDRVKRFENSTKTLDGSTMEAIKNLLEGKIKSANY
jgi:soluble cytochrome b562